MRRGYTMVSESRLRQLEEIELLLLKASIADDADDARALLKLAIAVAQTEHVALPSRAIAFMPVPGAVRKGDSPCLVC